MCFFCLAGSFGVADGLGWAVGGFEGFAQLEGRKKRCQEEERSTGREERSLGPNYPKTNLKPQSLRA